MAEQKKYIIVAGVNGAGKSTLYRLQTELFPTLLGDTKRLNADEILQRMGGDWHKNSDTFQAMRLEVQQIHKFLEEGTSIHVETTLAGHAKSQLNLIEKAHKNGYEVTVIYVAIKNADMAIERVNQRVKKGGHGIPANVIKKRYKQSHDNLPIVTGKVEKVYVFDNSQRLVPIYMREKEVEIKNSLRKYPWINQQLNY